MVRYDPKEFRQRRPDGAGGWDWQLGQTRRVLFHLPQLLDAKRDDAEVFVVEGEEDVLALERAGAVATCNPMGAGKWREEYTRTLAGARLVFVVADQDAPGRKHAHQVASALRPHVGAVIVCSPAAGKDARDHLAAGRSLDGFVEGDGSAVGEPETHAPDDWLDRLIPGDRFLFDDDATDAADLGRRR